MQAYMQMRPASGGGDVLSHEGMWLSMVGIHEHNSHACMLSEKMPLLTRMFLNAMVPLSICMLLFCFSSR